MLNQSMTLCRTGASLAVVAAIILCGNIAAAADDVHAAAGHGTMEHADHPTMADHSSADVHAGNSPLPVDNGIVVDFSLVDRDGKHVTDEDLRGRYLLLGFGFTHCDHVCPMMGVNMGRVVRDASRPTTGIFVSVDTERDTPAISDDYARHFGKSMLGLSGSIEQINAAARNFKVSYAVTKTQDHYTVQHTANLFLIDPDGNLVDVFSFAENPERILAAIR